MNTQNLLFNKRVRRKKKGFFNLFFFYPYYESESISFKEKIYTLFYNLERTGVATQGEFDWLNRMLKMDRNKVDQIELEFKNDYREFAMSNIPNPPYPVQKPDYSIQSID